MTSHFVELTREDDGKTMIVNTEHITHITCREPSGSTIHLAGCTHLPKGIQVRESFPHSHDGELKAENLATASKAPSDVEWQRTKEEVVE